MALGKQAKVLKDPQIDSISKYLRSKRNGDRNTVVFLLSVKAGLRAKEIASLTWKMVLNSEGEIGSTIDLTNQASKGKSSGRIIPLNKDLRSALATLFKQEQSRKRFNREVDHVVRTERSPSTSSQAIVNMFQNWYKELGYVGCSSHSGRRTFITKTARKISLVGGSLRDIQILAGHSQIGTTQRYIDMDTEAQKKVVDLI